MTCVVAAVDRYNRKRILMSADSAGVSGQSWGSRTRTDAKVFARPVKVIWDRYDSTEETMLFGFSYSFRFGQILAHNLANLPPTAGNEPQFPYIFNEIVAKMRQTLTHHGYFKEKTDEPQDETHHHGQLLIGFMGQIYKVYTDCQVEQIVQPFNAIGAGEDYALGCLYGLYYRLKTEHCVSRAMEAAAEFSAAVRPPFNTLSTC